MRILFVNPILRTSETDEIPRVESLRDSLAWTVASALQELGHEVVLYAAEDFRPTRNEDVPFRIEWGRTWFRRLFKPRQMPFMPGLARHLLRHADDYDLVVSSEVFSFHSLIPAVLCPRKLVVWHELSLHPRMMRRFASRLWYLATAPVFARAAVVVPRSARARRFLAWRLPNVSVEPVGHGVDLDKFRPLPRGDHFLVCSQLVERKRVDHSIRMFARFARKYPEKGERLLVVGDGEQREELVRLAASEGVSDRVEFLGRLDHDRLAVLLGSAKALLVASRRDFTLLSISEALACATPVVCHLAVDTADLVAELGLGIASDDWNEDDLNDVVVHSGEYVARCLEHRGKFGARHLASRLPALHERFVGARRPRVAVISQNCFAQCEIPLLPALGERYDLRWRIFHPANDEVGYTPEELERAGVSAGVDTVAMRFASRLRSLRTALCFVRLFSGIFLWKPDLVYVDAVGLPWLAPIVRLLFGRRKVLWAIHDAQEHGAGRGYRVASFYKKAIAAVFDRFHLLSCNQMEIFRKEHPGRQCHLAPHPPLDFGSADGSPPTDRIRFLFFGYLAPHKGIDLLLEAASALWERGVRGFEVVVAGRPEPGLDLVGRFAGRPPFVFDARAIPTSEVPNLFAGAHWVVLPYRHATQSGPLSLAAHYRVPPVAADLPAFREQIRGGVDGLVFASGSVESLQEVLERAVAGGRDLAARARAEWAKRADGELESCASSYVAMFDDCLGRPRP